MKPDDKDGNVYFKGSKKAPLLPSECLIVRVSPEAIDALKKDTVVCIEDPSDHRRLLFPVHEVRKARDELVLQKTSSSAAACLRRPTSDQAAS